MGTALKQPYFTRRGTLLEWPEEGTYFVCKAIITFDRYDLVVLRRTHMVFSNST